MQTVDAPYGGDKPAHWISTAAVLTAVVGAAILLAPASGNAADSPGGRSAQGPDPKAVHYPLDCAGLPVAIARQATGDLDRDGRAETAVAVHCQAAGGNPPHGIYVIAEGAGPSPTPRVVATLLDPLAKLTTAELAVREGQLSATVLGYSTDSVPRCCPDQKRKIIWEWDSGRFTPVPGPISGTT